MYDASAIGGVADVHYLAGPQAHGLWQPAKHAQVFITASRNSDAEYVVESFSAAGKRIQFCGHGALSAAFVVFEARADGVELLKFADAREAGNQTWLGRRAGDDRITLVYSRPVVSDCDVPAFASLALGAQAIAAAEAGGPSGYLILELADGVQSLQPDFAAISAATDRAIVVTARAQHADGEGCVYRYFAPQYGTPEDTATGSAAVQLAAYWSGRIKRDSFTARQLSAGGACLLLGCYGDVIELTARVGYR